MPRLAHVVPLSPVDGVYTYTVPDELAAEARAGARVVVPFGRRTLTGVVVETAEGDSSGLKTILDVLDARPALTPELLGLTRWVAGYYLCSWGEAIKAALPGGTTVESRRRVVGLAPPDAVDGKRARTVLAFLQTVDSASPQEVAAALKRKTVPTALLRRLEAAGHVRLDEDLQAATARAKTMRWLRILPPAAGAAPRGDRQRAVLDALAAADGGTAVQAEILRATGATSSTVKSLAARGWLETFDAPVERRADGLDAPVDARPSEITLHPSQRAALDAITGVLASGRPETILLHGVTGSGKTEVYLRALAAVLERGQTGIVLVPEIALTPQTVRRFRAPFGDRVAVLHSRMSPGERLDAWTAIRDGRYPIVIGPRSAVFAPLADLGIVIVDEEHEASYKQFDPAPRYHARDVAVLRTHRAGAVCLLGSATPSLESVANAAAGKYRLLEMPERVPVAGRAAAPLPAVRVVDLAREYEVRRLKGALSHDLREAIGERLRRGEQTILLQNRRGYAPVITCDACGWTPTCRDCAVSLTVHNPRGGAGGRNLRCHYCGRAERLPSACPQCDDNELALLGRGTQRVEEEIADVFPEARTLRMDLDTTSRKGAHRRILDAFGRGDADILLGTQMVAKGLDFPRVTLVGVVNADTGMLLPDFRAGERTFQLLAQVAGRAGRHDLPGEVVLQTRNPDHAAIRHALAHDFHAFARDELADRQALGYPPYGRLVGIEFKGPDERRTEELATRWTAALDRHASHIAGADVLGPTAALVGRIKTFWRFHTILRAPRTVPMSVLAGAVRAASDAVRTPSGFRVNLDVDPVGLY